jgi:polysaccharide export outer membrane protein
LPPPADTNQGADELIAENDLLEIDVFQVNDLDRTVRVDSRGDISLSLIGVVPAKGRTIPDLENDIEKRYGAKFLQNPEVSVFMKESAGLRVTVDGVVIKPGIYPVSSTTTLLQIIAQAGGFQEIADESKLYVFRQFGGKKIVANYDVKLIRSGKRTDPRIFGGDVIVSFSSDAKVAFRNLREALGLATGAARFAPI